MLQAEHQDLHQEAAAAAVEDGDGNESQYIATAVDSQQPVIPKTPLADGGLQDSEDEVFLGACISDKELQVMAARKLIGKHTSRDQVGFSRRHTLLSSGKRDH